MRNLTPMELFSKGHDAMEKEEYLKAEKYFLASLCEYSKNSEDYVALLGSLDQLSLYIYSKGNFENKDRALEFYKVFSRVDDNASFGYAMALINGVFGYADYNEAIKQLSKAKFNDQLYMVAYLLHKGKGLEKDNHKAALLLKSKLLKYSNRAHETKELYDSIGIEIEITGEELENEIRKNLNEIFKGRTLELEKTTNKDSLVIEFCKNKNNIPDIEIKTNVELAPEKKESDFEYQKKNLEAIYSAASMSPVFKSNPKYCTGKFAELTPYISYNDVMSYKFIIRGRPVGEVNTFDAKDREIIAEYDSLESLVNDGWHLS